MPLKVYRKKRTYRPKTTRPRRAALTRSPQNHAVVSEVQPGVLPGATYAQFNDITLAQYPRASTIAQGFQVYRIKYLEFTLRPAYDTFTPGGGSQVPALYKMIDRNGSLPATGSLAMLRNMGCTPIRFDDKQIVIRYKPGVILTTGSGITTVNTKPMISPWLSTDLNAGVGSWAASQVKHFGLTMFLDAAQQSSALEVKAVFEFAKPNWNIGQ